MSKKEFKTAQELIKESEERIDMPFGVSMFGVPPLTPEQKKQLHETGKCPRGLKNSELKPDFCEGCMGATKWRYKLLLWSCPLIERLIYDNKLPR